MALHPEPRAGGGNNFYCGSCRSTQRFLEFFDHLRCSRCGRRLDVHDPVGTGFRQAPTQVLVYRRDQARPWA